MQWDQSCSSKIFNVLWMVIELCLLPFFRCSLNYFVISESFLRSLVQLDRGAPRTFNLPHNVCLFLERYLSCCWHSAQLLGYDVLCAEHCFHLQAPNQRTQMWTVHMMLSYTGPVSQLTPTQLCPWRLLILSRRFMRYKIVVTTSKHIRRKSPLLDEVIVKNGWKCSANLKFVWKKCVVSFKGMKLNIGIRYFETWILWVH